MPPVARKRPHSRRSTRPARSSRNLPARRNGQDPWASLTRDEFLDLRIRDLGVRLEGTWIEECIDALYQELDERGLSLRPHCWLSSEWFSPEGVPGIGIPFYLAHPRLMRLERTMMLEVEGGTRTECMRILRHETGHALQHAFDLHRRKRWRELFGPSTTPYPESYRPNPASRKYVQHLRLYYAQSHPDEDFAETFAVWMGPRSAWQRRYQGWGALQKLHYVDELMEELRGGRPRRRSREVVEPLSSLTMTLREYYEGKRAQYTVSYPTTYDRELLKVFSNEPKHARRELASRFIQRHRAEIRRTVARWTGEYEFTLDQLLRDMIGRCRELKLRVAGGQRQVLLDFAGMLAVRTVHFLYSRRVSIAM
ncbi:MAG: putative zinc-binding metallopeptidase [Gemmatimonadaceae bacterium]